MTVGTPYEDAWLKLELYDQAENLVDSSYDHAVYEER